MKLMECFLPKIVKDIYIYRSLLYQLIRRDISTRYQGSYLGIAWSFFFPLLTLGVYAVVFGIILTPRWPNMNDPAQFTLILFSGLLVFNFFSECISRAPSLIVSNANYVKKVVFPIEVLIWVPIGTALFHLLLGIMAWTFLGLILGNKLNLTMLVIPLAVLPLTMFTAGICWFLAALGVFVRDVGQLIGVSVQLLLYLGPIIYPREILPERFQWLMSINPITIPVEQFRNILNYGVSLDLTTMAIYMIVSLLFVWLGKTFFEKTRHGFAKGSIYFNLAIAPS